MRKEFSAARAQFPILKEKIQLSSCSQSAMHVNVKEAIKRYMRSWEEHGMDWPGWMEACENARAEFARMINADTDEVAIVSSVSHAISSVAASLPIRDRKKVQVTGFDFPAVGHVWLSHKDKYDVSFIDRDFIKPSDYTGQVDKDTLLVSTSHVSFYNGYKQNLQEVAKSVHEKGAYLFVDAYQSLAQCPIDVKAMDIDMLTAGLQKYALGIPGIAFLYMKKKIAVELMPKVTGWFGQENPFLFDIRNVEYAEGARRFDSGTFPMINGFAAEAALKVLNQFSISDIESHLQEMSRTALHKIEATGLTVKSPTNPEEKGSSTAVYVKNASEVEARLKEKGIIVSARNDVIRIAPHFYNTPEDVETAIEELAKMIN